MPPRRITLPKHKRKDAKRRAENTVLREVLASADMSCDELQYMHEHMIEGLIALGVKYEELKNYFEPEALRHLDEDALRTVARNMGAPVPNLVQNNKEALVTIIATYQFDLIDRLYYGGTGRA